MDASNWIALAAVALSIGGPLIAYGSLRQKVTDQDRRLAAVEGRDSSRQTDREAVVRLEEQMKHLQSTLERMDDKLTAALQGKPAQARSRAVSK